MKDKETLLAEWDKLQCQPTNRNAGLIMQKASAEISILEGLLRLGETVLPNGLPINELRKNREEVIEDIQCASPMF